jgi:hypothetical protein
LRFRSWVSSSQWFPWKTDGFCIPKLPRKHCVLPKKVFGGRNSIPSPIGAGWTFRAPKLWCWTQKLTRQCMGPKVSNPMWTHTKTILPIGTNAEPLLVNPSSRTASQSDMANAHHFGHDWFFVLRSIRDPFCQDQNSYPWSPTLVSRRILVLFFPFRTAFPMIVIHHSLSRI